MTTSYEIPSWAGKPPAGLHLDVMKDDKLVQKLMVDEKKCYLFGRNNQMNDFCIDHASCSRVHSAFVYHKHLQIAYLVDLGSTHGTFIGSLRLEAHKPTKLQINSKFNFGASTRRYILRERPSAGQYSDIMEDLPIGETCDGTFLGLPECQTELDNLTEYNTAHNRRISMLGIADDNRRKSSNLKHGRKQYSVTFNDEEIIINPEDIDPNVGRFRNLIQTSVIPAKRARLSCNHLGLTNTISPITKKSLSVNFQASSQINTNTSATLNQDLLYHDLPTLSAPSAPKPELITASIGRDSDLSMLPNPAPDVTPIVAEDTIPLINQINQERISTNKAAQSQESLASKTDRIAEGPQKKKYAKEAWPGRKPMLGQL